MNITTAPAANLPPLSEMIMTAIETLTEANESTIRKHIQSTYASLRSDCFDSLLTELDQMRQNGQLTLVNGSYRKLVSDAPPLKRGRGRPPKGSKPLRGRPPLISANGLSPARPRGRPPKARDPLAPPTVKPAAASTPGRKRGRPSKAGKAAPAAPAAVGATGERRGRGRPPKVRPPVVTPVGS